MPKPLATQSLLPRKSPRQRRSTNTVATILEAAAHILEELGFDGYTTNAVAARAGVSIGSVYQYFPNRDSVTRALIERRSEELLTAILQINETAKGWNGIHCVIEIAVRQQLRHGRLARLLDLEEARMPAIDTVRNQGKQAAAFIGTYLAQAGVPDKEMNTVLGDVMAITLGMVDAAGRHAEVDEAGLVLRVGKAVFGYINAMINIDPDE